MRRVRLAPAQRISTIYNGVNVEEFDAVPPAVPDPKYFTLGCFGRLSAQKNQKVLLHALALLRETLPQARLLLVGGGEDETALRALAQRLNLDDMVIFAGEQAEPRPMYFACDVLVQPSRWESCPYSVLEAMAARRPLIAAAVGGVPELLGANGEAGVLCKPASPSVIAAIVRQLAADEACRQAMGAAARQRVEKYFRLETMVGQTLAVYEKVA
jgi:glycosyltransferase involved in cell wall biosynthesis